VIGVQLNISKNVRAVFAQGVKFGVFFGSSTVLFLSAFSYYLKKYYPDQIKLSGAEEKHDSDLDSKRKITFSSLLSHIK
jgi:hypothetical protein